MKKDRRRSKKNRKKTAINNKIVCVISVFFALVFISTIFSISNINNQKIINGISIGEIDVSRLEYDDAVRKLREKFDENIKKEIKLINLDYEITMTANQISSRYDVENMVKEAYKIGRRGNIIQNNFEIIKTYIFGKKFEIKLQYDEELLQKFIQDINMKLPNALQDYSYYIEDENLIITSRKNRASNRKRFI
ncbi:MAG: peptidoglycan binding domain-containing protein [Clostridia bacterium]|nr:peptidoglycan binding domain-containing protein [Clostridia bacterium]